MYATTVRIKNMRINKISINIFRFILVTTSISANYVKRDFDFTKLTTNTRSSTTRKEKKRKVLNRN